MDSLTDFTEAIAAACYSEAEVYAAPSESAASEEIEQFEKTWGQKYPLIVRSWRNNWPEISTFFKYPPQIRKIIYTTNMIECYHQQSRKVTNGKSIFPSDEALKRCSTRLPKMSSENGLDGFTTGTRFCFSYLSSSLKK